MNLKSWRKALGDAPVNLDVGNAMENVRVFPHKAATSQAALPLGTFWAARQQVILLALVGLALGLLLAAQFQSRPLKAPADTDSARDRAAQTIQGLEAEQADLKKQIASLRAQIDAQQAAATSKESTADISQELEKQKLVSGLVAVKGPGLRVVLDDSTASTIPANDDPALYLVHEYHLRDVVNVLWGAGAEAIAINGERLVSTSSIYCVGSTILVNDTRMSPPYEILAIGDPATLDAAIAQAESLRSLKSRVEVYDLQFQVSRESELTLPAYSGSLSFRYATAGEPLPTPNPGKQQ